MTFEWDPEKAAGNRRKHSIDFADTVGVFEDPRALTCDDDHAGERRHVTMGLDFLGRVISARKASPAERRQYNEEG